MCSDDVRMYMSVYMYMCCVNSMLQPAANPYGDMMRSPPPFEAHQMTAQSPSGAAGACAWSPEDT